MDPVTRSPELLGGNWGRRRTSPRFGEPLGLVFRLYGRQKKIILEKRKNEGIFKGARQTK